MLVCPKDPRVPTKFAAKLLKYLLNLETEPEFDRAHRTLCAKPKEGEPPRPMIISVNKVQARNIIRRRAGEASPLLHNGKRVYVFPGFTPTVAKWRAAFIKVKRELYLCANMKFGLQYPATLHITVPNQALKFVNKKLKKSQDGD